MKVTGRMMVWGMIFTLAASSMALAQQKEARKQPKTNSSKDSTDRVYGGSVKQNAREKDTNDKDWKPQNPAEITPDRSSDVSALKSGNASRQAQDSARSVTVLGTDTGVPARSESPGDTEVQPDGTNTVQRATYNIAGAQEPGRKTNVPVNKATEKLASTENNNSSVTDLQVEEKSIQTSGNETNKREETSKTKRDKKKSKKRKNRS